MRELTPRQHEALSLLAEGWSYGEIAGRMGISEHGVRELLRAAYLRLGVSGHVAAFRALGWLDPQKSS